jgi:hypothetical protein
MALYKSSIGLLLLPLPRKCLKSGCSVKRRILLGLDSCLRATQKRVTFCANFLRVSMFADSVKQNLNFFFLLAFTSITVKSGLAGKGISHASVRTAQKIKYQNVDKTTRSTKLLNFSNSTAVAWVWNLIRHCSRLPIVIKRLDCASSSPWQAAPVSSATPEIACQQSLPRCEAILLVLDQHYTVTTTCASLLSAYQRRSPLATHSE